ncbi:MAG: hypothetical protein NVSMB32_17290 [Actinomycetota bacterium]
MHDRSLSVKKYLAEFIASFMVVFIAAGAIVADVYLTHVRLTDSFGPLGIVVAYGVAVAIAMLVMMPISGGHVNPAISIAAFVSRRLSAKDTAGYVLAQLLGAVVAAFLLRGITPKNAFDFVSGGVPGLGQGISVLQGAGIEAALTFFLALTFWAVVVDSRGPRVLAPLAVGGFMVAAGLAGSAFTGAALNPARWLGSALAGTHGASWLVWVAGPLLGALLGSLTYETLFLSESPPLGDGALLTEPYDVEPDAEPYKLAPGEAPRERSGEEVPSELAPGEVAATTTTVIHDPAPGPVELP